LGAQFGGTRLCLRRRAQEGAQLAAHRAVEGDGEQAQAGVIVPHLEVEARGFRVAGLDAQRREHRVQPRAHHADVGRQQRDRGHGTRADTRGADRKDQREVPGRQRQELAPADPGGGLAVERCGLHGDAFGLRAGRQRGTCGLGPPQRQPAAGQGADRGHERRRAHRVALEAERDTFVHRHRIREVGVDAPGRRPSAGPQLQRGQQRMHAVHHLAAR
jgi:hypothetical protein